MVYVWASIDASSRKWHSTDRQREEGSMLGTEDMWSSSVGKERLLGMAQLAWSLFFTQSALTSMQTLFAVSILCLGWFSIIRTECDCFFFETFISKPGFIRDCLDGSYSFWNDFNVPWKQVAIFSCGTFFHDGMKYDFRFVHMAQDKEYALWDDIFGVSLCRKIQ